MEDPMTKRLLILFVTLAATVVTLSGLSAVASAKADLEATLNVVANGGCVASSVALDW